MQQLLPISKKLLLYPYCLSFFFLVVSLFDIFVYHEALQKMLPRSLSEIFIYYAIFELPHIIASFFMFADKEYISVFKKILFRNILLLVLCGSIVIIFNKNLFYILYITYTLYHVIRQQFGIAKIFGLIPSNYLTYLQLVYIVTGTLALLSFTYIIPTTWFHFSVFLSLFSSLLYFILEQKNRSNLYLTLCVLSFTAATILYGTGYIILGFLALRIVHDITAFIFYSTHNYNRKNESSSNLLFSSPITQKMNPLYLTPLLAISLNLIYIYTVQYSSDTILHSLLLSLYFGLAMIHYNIEGSVWKNNSLARKYIHIV